MFHDSQVYHIKRVVNSGGTYGPSIEHPRLSLVFFLSNKNTYTQL